MTVLPDIIDIGVLIPPEGIPLPLEGTPMLWLPVFGTPSLDAPAYTCGSYERNLKAVLFAIAAAVFSLPCVLLP